MRRHRQKDNFLTPGESVQRCGFYRNSRGLDKPAWRLFPGVKFSTYGSSISLMQDFAFYGLRKRGQAKLDRASGQGGTPC